jgi:hypothetical protein
MQSNHHFWEQFISDSQAEASGVTSERSRDELADLS